MRGAFLVCLALVGSAGFSWSAQTPPPDVPKNHWAYAAVAEMYQLGVLVGYPDGTFKGTRPLSRYELAVSLAKLSEKEARLIHQIGDSIPTKSSSVELKNLDRELASIRDQLAAITPQKMDVDSLKSQMGSLRTQLSVLNASASKLRSKLDKTQP
jgi:hypothetical protein